MYKRRITISIFFIATTLLILVIGRIVSQNIQFSKTEKPTETSYSELSPNKKWGVLYDNLTQNGEVINFIRIINLNKKTEYRFDDNQLQEFTNCFGFNTLFWSSDSKSLYFEPWTCQHSNRVLSGRSPVLYRVELATGSFTDVLPIVESEKLTDQNFYEYSFSSDNNFLAYIQPDLPSRLFLRDMITDEVTEFQFDSQFQEAGCIGWAFGEHVFSFSTASTSIPRSETTSSLFNVDMSTKEIYQIAKYQNIIYCPAFDQSYTPKGMIKVTKIELEKLYNSCDSNACVDLLLNPRSGEFSTFE